MIVCRWFNSTTLRSQNCLIFNVINTVNVVNCYTIPLSPSNKVRIVSHKSILTLLSPLQVTNQVTSQSDPIFKVTELQKDDGQRKMLVFKFSGNVLEYYMSRGKKPIRIPFEDITHHDVVCSMILFELKSKSVNISLPSTVYCPLDRLFLNRNFWIFNHWKLVLLNWCVFLRVKVR